MMYHEEIVYAVAMNKIFLNRPSISNSILENLGSAEALFQMSREQLSLLFRNTHIVSEIQSPNTLKEAEREIREALENGINILYIKDKNYPNNLKECPDAPIILYKRGDINLNSHKIISIVGTRNATQYGIRSCEKIISDLRKTGINPIILSGLAFGIDISAHIFAMAENLQTVGVLAGGYDKIYPSSHHSVAVNMTQPGVGALITEFPSGTQPLKINFISRNRIIAGMCDSLIVIESAAKGGALITAKYAQSYSKEIFALPGRIGDKYSEGSNDLIRTNRAALFSNVEEMIKSLNWQCENSVRNGKLESKYTDKELFPSGDELKLQIVTLLREHLELDIDELQRLTQKSIQSLSINLVELEIEGYIRSLNRNRYEVI